MTGRAIQGNIQFEGGEGQYITRELNIPLYCLNAIIDLLYDSNLVGGWKGRGKGKRKREGKEKKQEPELLVRLEPELRR